jgi:YggT family protein
LSGIIDTVLSVYFLAVLAWVVLSWIPISSEHPLGRIQSFLDRIIEPVIRPIRRVVPPLRLGGGALDLSPIILLVGIQLLRRLL